jgi:hypothetical protein
MGMVEEQQFLAFFHTLEGYPAWIKVGRIGMDTLGSDGREFVCAHREKRRKSFGFEPANLE